MASGFSSLLGQSRSIANCARRLGLVYAAPDGAAPGVDYGMTYPDDRTDLYYWRRPRRQTDLPLIGSVHFRGEMTVRIVDM
jgi:hypothetical protein